MKKAKSLGSASAYWWSIAERTVVIDIFSLVFAIFDILSSLVSTEVVDLLEAVNSVEILIITRMKLSRAI